MFKMMKMLILTGLILLVTGCWNRRELNELSIAVAMGLDAVGKEDIIVSLQVVNPSEIASKQNGGAGGSPVSTFHIRGKSVFETVRRMITQENRRVYLAHLRMLVIGEELARRGIAEPIDFLSRDHEFRTDFFLVVAKDSRAEDVLKVLTPQEKIPANKLYSSLDTSEETWAGTSKVTLDVLLDNLASAGKTPVLTGILLKGSSNKGAKMDNLQTTQAETVLQYNGLAVFKRDKLLGWLNENESKGYHYVEGKVRSTVIANECQSGFTEVELIRTRAKVRGAVRRGEPAVDINVHAEGNLGDTGCKLDLSDPASIGRIERMTEEVIKEDINESIRTAQQHYRADIFGFGEAIRRAAPSRWKQWKTDWDSMFADLTVNTHVDVKIRSIGTINQPVKSRIRK
jgi:spore germination protein KC